MSEYKIAGYAHYDDAYPTKAIDNDKVMEMISAVAVQLREKGYCYSGNDHQNAYLGMPVFEDGTAFRATMRCWGALMAMAYSTEEKRYGYMDFYMYSSLETAMPEEEADVEASEEDTGAFPNATQEDMDLVKQSIAMEMPLMTTDKGVRELYDFISEWVQSQLEEEEDEDNGEI